MKRGSIVANLAEIYSEIDSLTILPFFTSNINNTEYPLIMLEQSNTARDWESLNVGNGPISNVTFSTTIWGMVAGFEDHLMDPLASELEASLADVLNFRHEAFQFEGWEFYFKERIPISDSTYGVRQMGSNMARGFNSTFSISAILSNPQESQG